MHVICGRSAFGMSPSNRLQTAAWFCNRSTSARCVVAVAAFKDGWHPACRNPVVFIVPSRVDGWMGAQDPNKI
jgi:hypothetical protein